LNRLLNRRPPTNSSTPSEKKGTKSSLGGDQNEIIIVDERREIYLDKPIGTTVSSKIIRALREYDAEYNRWDMNPPIIMYINSPGGSIIDGNAIIDCMNAISSPVITYVEGYAASMGALIAMSGAPGGRVITPSSYMMIHQLSSIAWGTYQELKDDMRWTEMLHEQAVNRIAKTCGQRKSKVRSDLKHDYWMSPEDCLEYGKKGMVDQIVGA